MKNLLFTLATRIQPTGRGSEAGGHLNVTHTRVKWYPVGFANELGICDPSYQRAFK